MTFKRTLREIEKPVQVSGGAALGLLSGGFFSELTTRALGYTGYLKAGVASLVKLALAVLFLGTGKGYPSTNTYMWPAATSTLGSIILDWIAAYWPGGLPGLAERTAVVVRTWSTGVEKVQAEIANNSELALTKNAEVHVPYENSHTVAEVEIAGAPLSKDHVVTRAKPSMVLEKSFV